MAEDVRVVRDGAVAVVELNRPDRLNALNKPMWPAIEAAFIALSAEDAVRCVVLRGAGPAFCTGADISEFAAERDNPAQARAYGRIMDRAYDAMRACPHPVIAAIRGACTGAGLVLALLCDLRLASDTARIGAAVNRLGLSMPPSEFGVLVEVLGRVQALEIVLEARLYDAAESLAKGMVGRVVPDAEHDAAVADLARRIAAGAPLVHRRHKALARRLASGTPLSEAEIAAGYDSFATADYREGITAFLEKRSPRFQGR